MIACVIFLILSIAPFTISYRQFREKGCLFNNACFWASPEERRRMDEHPESKKPHYRQSGFVFLLAGVFCLLYAAWLATGFWLWMLAAGTAVLAAAVYAVASSVKNEKSR